MVNLLEKTFRQCFQNKPAAAGVPQPTGLYIDDYSSYSNHLAINKLHLTCVLSINSLRQQSNFTLNIAVIIVLLYAIESLLKRKLKTSAVFSSLDMKGRGALWFLFQYSGLFLFLHSENVFYTIEWSFT